MSSVIVSVHAGAGVVNAYARQGTQEHHAASSSTELAVRLAGAKLLQRDLVDVRAERKDDGFWQAITIAGGAS